MVHPRTSSFALVALAAAAACQDEAALPCRAGAPVVLVARALAPQGRAVIDPHLAVIEESEAAPTIALAPDGTVVVTAWVADDDAALPGVGTAAIMVVDDARGALLSEVDVPLVGDATRYVQTSAGLVTLGTHTVDGAQVLAAAFVDPAGVAEAPAPIPGVACTGCELVWSARAHGDRVSIVWLVRRGEDLWIDRVSFVQLDARGALTRSGTLTWASPPAALRAARGALWIEDTGGSWRVDDDLTVVAGPIGGEADAPPGVRTSAWGDDGAIVAWRVASDDGGLVPRVVARTYDASGAPQSGLALLAVGQALVAASASDAVGVVFLDSFDLLVALASPDGRKRGADLAGPSLVRSDHVAVALSLGAGGAGALYVAGDGGLVRVELTCDP